MHIPSQLLFLPGALGRTDFWRPAAAQLRHPARQVHVAWPGFAGEPADPSIRHLDDLAAGVVRRIDRPTALVAQSMGGVVAVLAALARPALVTHLVLSVTSGGLDVASLGAEDWRPAVLAEHAALPDWFIGERRDLTPQLPTLQMPVLLLWGGADPISPVRVGERLAALLPRADLRIFPKGGHDLGFVHATEVAALIDDHLAGDCTTIMPG
jgi:pimeloyl-ACP methyl ester carboxylesterase